MQLPLTHPLRLAEEIATLDVLSNGRVDFGVGRGGNPTHFVGFGVPISESRERMTEPLELVLRAFANDRFSYEGRSSARMTSRSHRGPSSAPIHR